MKDVNLKRLKDCMKRAEAGEELTIGFLGGSITQGSLATTMENTYAYRVFTWWKQTFPKANVHYVNGGIGGTTSHYGVSRAVTDVLMYQPDFIVVDFSVNDEADIFFQETYEGVVRKLLSWDSKPAVVLLNNVFYDTGLNAQEYHNEVGNWYQVPHVSVRDTIYQRMKAGEYIREELEEKEPVFPKAMTENAYENAKRLTIREISPKLCGFHADTEEKTGHLDHFKNGWIGKKAGDSIHFEVTASCIAVQYRKTIQLPAARAELVLDGDKEKSILLDGNFDEDWGDCLYLEKVLHHGEKKIHTVDITILPEEVTDTTPFYLMSLIIA